ncbi:DUF2339 domain-containing protein [Sphingobacteriales bacterium UPWRP_1]|nr:hypothetical protein BVG80_03305 [Sphingobacteriales bacterium TSM_CSM]PSJ73393.1 DUF2339 domain-containing protein [Sphingobacteriales bacterium UPWRP_1]
METLLVILVVVLLFMPLAVIYLLFKVSSLSGKLHDAEQLVQELSSRLSKLEFNLKHLSSGKKEVVETELPPAVDLPERQLFKHPEAQKEITPGEELLPPIPQQEELLLQTGKEEEEKKTGLPEKEKQQESILVVDVVDYNHAKPDADTITVPPAEKGETTGGRASVWSWLGGLGGESWIGVVGSVLLVIGAVFLITYAALKVPPLYRFVIISGFSAVVGVLGFALQRYRQWEALAAWLRSIGGALFLFGCLGSGAIPGLQWINNPAAALGLLSGGILVNLVLGYLGGKQVFASLHVVLSLTALSMAPHSITTLLIGAVVTLFGIALVFREKWDAHLLVTLTAFFVFHFIWYVSLGTTYTDLQPLQHYTAIAVYLVVGICGAVVHYRQTYSQKRFEALPFIAHLLNWLYMSAAIAAHSMGTQWKTVYIGIGALAAFFLARRAKKAGIDWLYYTDTLLAQIAMLLALLSLTDWKWSADHEITILSLMYLEALVFIAIMLLEQEQWLYRTGTLLTHLLGAGLLVLGLSETINGNETGNLLHAGMMLVSLAASGGFLAFMMQRFEATPFNAIDSWYHIKQKRPNSISVTGIITGLLPFVVYAYLYNQLWAVYAVAMLFIVLLYLRNRAQVNGLGIGLLAGVLLLHYAVWQNVYDYPQWSRGYQFAYTLPLLPVSAAVLVWSYVKSGNTYLRWPGMYLLVFGLAFTAYYFLELLWAFAPALVWLAMSLAALETAKWLQRHFAGATDTQGEPDRYLLQLGYWLLVAFMIRHFTVHTYLQQEVAAGIKVRWLAEAAGFGALLYWALQQPPQSGKVYPLWSFAQPLMPEMLMAFSIGVALTEVQEIWYPAVWAGLALAALLISVKRQQPETSRLRLYALGLSWAASVNIIYHSINQISSGMGWLEPAWVSGFAAIVLLFVFVTLFYPYRHLQGLYFPPLISGVLQTVTGLILRQSMWWIFYPLFVAVAVFLYYSFHKSVLTLWWVAECFLIFSLAIYTRQNHFRYVAFAGIVVCLIRLVVYDLAQTGTLARALAFLGMGGILLAMYVVGNRFKDRMAEQAGNINTQT